MATLEKAPTLQLKDLTPDKEFIGRHIGPSEDDVGGMLEHLNLLSLAALIDETLPKAIHIKQPLKTGKPTSEADMLTELKAIASKNEVYRSYIGVGYYNTHTPSVIARNVLENPGWYTAYTPYQAEIAQGRLEALLNFQQMVMDLTGMELANASLLDEATAAAEAMTLCKRSSKSKSNTYFVADDVHPQTLDVIRTRADYMGFEVIVGNPEEAREHDVFGIQLQYPGSTGEVRDLSPVISAAHEAGALVAVATDLLALALLTPPGEMGADVVLGSAQRFGVPLGYGGPHAAFFATREAYKRSLPGRVIGVSVDVRGKTALRMAMQTREQHIRREKATSNICTAQALLANMASFYAVYHGPDGIKKIAERTHVLTQTLAAELKKLGFKLRFESYFDTLTVETAQQQEIYNRGLDAHLNLRLVGDDALGISLDETTTEADLETLFQVFAGEQTADLDTLDVELDSYAFPKTLQRQSDYLTHPVFNRYHSETEVMRYIKRLENRDFSLVHGMIPLGSCTMKLNAASEMQGLSWREFADIHPFAPEEQARGYEQLLKELEAMLLDITGYDAISMQPNSGAQGEYAGLLAIRQYQAAQGEAHRNICLIPSSAHGTNPASATMMGMKVVVVKTDEDGNIDLKDLRAKAEQHSANLSALMITYPSTHGVFETGVQTACELIHRHGAQIYMDGANLNAQVGLTNPALIGSDVSHLNLHKTFCIPHGGGGPGMGPIGVKAHLAPYLPGHVEHGSSGAVSAAPYGSPLILTISWSYIKMMGAGGLKRATEVAILNANYIAKRLEGHFDVLYKGKNGRVAHECIIDIRPIKEACGVSEVDIAKRLMDYGFHAPTMSWPVVGTMMIEPTESESRSELDRFCDALISIRDEIRAIESGELDLENSPLRYAPHTLDDLVDPDWQRPYSREVAVFPNQQLRANKFWPSVNRIDDVYGDRNFVCSCPPLEAYEEDAVGISG